MSSNKTPRTTAEWLAPNKYDTDFAGFKSEVSKLTESIEDFIREEPKEFAESFKEDAKKLNEKLKELIKKF